MRTLDAWIEDRRVGAFTESPQPDGSTLYAFEYEEVTSKNIVSLTMVPIEGELRFESPTFPPPFDMVLPEGERRVRIEEARKILRTDAFSLLSYVGSNPVNRVLFLPPGEVPGARPPEVPAPAEIAGTKKGRELFRELVAKLDLRQGIAGVQPKVLGAPSPAKLSPDLRQFRGSTHILKASTSRFPFLAVNEHTCLSVFANAGICVPRTTLSADGELLLVERFDVQKDGHLTGFEEAAALMGETSATKYQREFGTMVDVLSEFISPNARASARSTLLQCLVLNHLLGNGDAHLKNFGVLYEDAARVSLAPIYDCVSTLPYIPDDVPALVLSFEWYSKAWWPRTKIEEFAVQYGTLSHAAIRRMFDEAFEAVLGGVQTVRRYGREIAGFADLAASMAKLWTARVDAFRAEDSGLKKPRTRAKS
jgi:serine/threonine-protein kinase HipA